MELRILVPLDDPDAEIHIRMRHHDTRLVFFAIVLTLRDEKGEWRESCSEGDVGESWEVGYGAIHTRYLEWRSTRR